MDRLSQDIEYSQGIGPIDSHLQLDSRPIWDKYIKQQIQVNR